MTTQPSRPPAPAAAALYNGRIAELIPTLLSWGDREALSPTYGCFDRTFWSWKFVDFPRPRFQEAAYALAHLHQTPFEGNPLHGDPRALTWARAAMHFWAGLQRRDGSFDEAYPFERSLAAAAFTGVSVGEAYLLLAEELSADEQQALTHSFARVGEWLCRNDERHAVLSNHLAAAATALEVVHQITGDLAFRARSERFLERVYDRQSPEGWYEEYGGADPGYQTHATFYLVRLWQYRQDDRLLESLKRSVAFLKYAVHPNGTIGGEYGSRNTEFYFPAGFEMLAGVCPDAALIAHFMRRSVAEQTAAGLSSVDRYNLLPMLNNYLHAAAAATPLDNLQGRLPFEGEEARDFPDTGLLVRSTPAYYAVVGLSKGGVLKAYDKGSGRMVASDCGYWARTANGRTLSSQGLNRSADWREENGRVTVKAGFARVNARTMTPWLFVAFRLFSMTLGRSSAVGYWLKDRLVASLVRRRRAAPLSLTRTLTFAPDAISVADRIERAGGERIESVRRESKFAAVHMGSPRYFQRQELDLSPADSVDVPADELMRTGAVALEHTWRF